MALLEEQFTETLQAGAPDITYEGEEGREQQVAQALWDKLPPQVRMQFGSFQQFFSSGAWKKVLEMLQQQMQGREGQQEVQDPRLQQEGQAVQEQGMMDQGIGGLMPQPQPMGMANGGDVRLASAPSIEDSRNEMAWNLFGKPLHELTEDELQMMEEHNRDTMAYGGIAGPDGRRAYGIGSWFQKKIMDPIKGAVKSPLGKIAGAAALGYGLNKFGIPGTGGAGAENNWGKNWFSNLNLGKRTSEILDKDNPVGKGTIGSGLGGLLSNPNFLIPAAGLLAGTFAKKDDPGYTGQGTGLNLQDVGRVANITDPKTAMAAGLRFSPDLETRKFYP